MKYIKKFESISFINNILYELRVESEDIDWIQDIDVESAMGGNVLVNLFQTIPNSIDRDSEDYYDLVDSFVDSEGLEMVEIFINKFCRKYNYKIVDEISVESDREHLYYQIKIITLADEVY